MGQAYQLYDGGEEIDRFEVRDLRVKSRFAIDNAFYDEFTPIFGPTLSMVYVALVRHANKDQKTWPSQSRVAAQLGLTRQWVGHQLHILEIFNLIRSIRVGKRCTSRYYLIDEKQWRRDFDNLLSEVADAIAEHENQQSKDKEVMLTQLTSPLLRTGVNIRVIRSVHKCLHDFTSNRKDKQGRIHKKDKVMVVKKVPAPHTQKPSEEANADVPEHVTIGTGSQKRTFFNPSTNQMVTEYFD